MNGELQAEICNNYSDNVRGGGLNKGIDKVASNVTLIK